MKAKVITIENKALDDITLNKDIFGQELREDILARVVKYQLAKRRLGNHKVKGRSEVAGTGKKAFRQKGTGRARAGAMKEAQHTGGGVVFGPQVRDHSFSLQKKVRKLGLKVALSGKVASGELIVLDKLDIKAKKTNSLVKNLKKIGISSGLFVDVEAKKGDSFFDAAQNIPHIDVLPTRGLNVYDILRHKHLVVTKDAIKAIEDRLK